MLKYKTHHQADYRFDRDAHHELAIKAATEGSILLKNEDDILPIKKDSRIALIGEFAKLPRYQGAGSSLVNPLKLDNAYDQAATLAHQPSVTYARGYDVNSDEPDRDLIAEACRTAASADVVVIMAGLTDAYESEGFDRSHMRMPPAQDELIRQVAKVNPNVVVVLCNGSPIEMPWLSEVKAVLEVYLSGQGGGSALWRLLYGEANPCGKLAETFPVKLEDCSASHCFPMGPTGVEYRESIYVGYRFYDKAGADVSFPFGHGLSYTRFEYSDLKLDSDKITDSDNLSFTFKIRNTGKTSGKEIAQVYIRDVESTIFRPDKELKEFVKVLLDPGEEQEIRLTLNKRAFAYYNVNIKDWQVESGDFEILVGASSRDIKLSARVNVVSSIAFDESDNKRNNDLKGYYTLSPNWKIGKDEFERLYGKPVIHRPVCKKGSYNQNSTLDEIRGVFAGRMLYRFVMANVNKVMRDIDEKTRLMIIHSIKEMPLRQLTLNSGGKIGKRMIDGYLLIFNGKFFKGLAKILFREKLN